MKKRRISYPNDKMEFKGYAHKLKPDELKLVERFYAEYYCGDIYLPDTLIKSEIGKEEAKRNHMATKRDIMDKKSNLSPLNDQTIPVYEDMSDDREIENSYHLHGFKITAVLIYDQTISEIKDGKKDLKKVLTRFFEKMNLLRRINWIDRKHKRKHNK